MLSGVQEWVGVGGPALFGGLFSAVGFIKEVFFSSRRCFSQKDGEEGFLWSWTKGSGKCTRKLVNIRPFEDGNLETEGEERGRQ